MAKKQTRRSISVSRTTYERLKAFCETNHISMSQLVETRVNDFLGTSDFVAAPVVSPSMAGNVVHGAQMAPAQMAPRALMPRPFVSAPRPEARPAPSVPSAPSAHASSALSSSSSASSSGSGTSSASSSAPAAPAASNPSGPMTSAAARYAVEPPLPIIKPRQETAAPKPAEKRPDQIFTF